MTCPKCNGEMERGFTTATGLIGRVQADTRESRILFVVPGTNTSGNLVRAFKQGLQGEPGDRRYRLIGARCSNCGFVEFYANADPLGHEKENT